MFRNFWSSNRFRPVTLETRKMGAMLCVSVCECVCVCKAECKFLHALTKSYIPANFQEM